MEKKTIHKACIVPMCKNTAFKTPSKIFIRLPNSGQQARRKKWIKACRRDIKDISEKSGAIYVCEDHFNVST